MSLKKLSQKGFTAVETMLAVIMVAIIAFVGYYVWHTQSQSSKTLSSASQVAASSPAKGITKKTSTAPTTTQKYFTIKEWGIRAPYSGTDTLTYDLAPDGFLVAVISAHLASIDSGCSTFGAGQISKLNPDDTIYGGGPTAAQDAVQNPEIYGHVGNFYYRYSHDNAGCANNTTDATTAAQNAANVATEALVGKFQSIP